MKRNMTIMGKQWSPHSMSIPLPIGHIIFSTLLPSRPTLSHLHLVVEPQHHHFVHVLVSLWQNVSDPISQAAYSARKDKLIISGVRKSEIRAVYSWFIQPIQLLLTNIFSWVYSFCPKNIKKQCTQRWRHTDNHISCKWTKFTHLDGHETHTSINPII